MPYPAEHLLLTVHWYHASYPLESGQIGLRFHVTGAGNLDATQAKVNACYPAVQALWRAAGAKMPAEYTIKFLRLARIDETGHYKPGTQSFDHIPPAVNSAGAGGSTTVPLQVACVSTLLATVERGQASKGRIYLPPIAATLPGAGTWTATDCDNRSSAVATMITGLNTALNGTCMIYSTGTQRNANGAGRKVVNVATGQRPDVQRRRAKGVPDVRGAKAGVTSAADPGEVTEGF